MQLVTTAHTFCKSSSDIELRKWAGRARLGRWEYEHKPSILGVSCFFYFSLLLFFDNKPAFLALISCGNDLGGAADCCSVFLFLYCCVPTEPNNHLAYLKTASFLQIESWFCEKRCYVLFIFRCFTFAEGEVYCMWAFHSNESCILPPLYAPTSSTLLEFPRSCSYNTSFSTTSQSSLRTSRVLDVATLFSFSKYTLFPSYTQLCSDLAFAYAYAYTWRATTGTWDLLPCIWRIGAFDF